jgi:hypothetical protein
MKQSLWNVSQAALAFAGLALSLAAVSPARASSVTFTYTGNDFNLFYNGNAGPSAATPWTTSDFISASFTFANPLPPNLNVNGTANTPTPESWTVSDGAYTFDTADDATLAIFTLQTNANGNIVGWWFIADSPICSDVTCSAYEDYSESILPSDTVFAAGESDQAHQINVNGCSDGCLAEVERTGTWTAATGSAPPSTVPEPSTAVVITLGGSILLLARRRKQRKPLATQRI